MRSVAGALAMACAIGFVTAARAATETGNRAPGQNRLPTEGPRDTQGFQVMVTTETVALAFRALQGGRPSKQIGGYAYASTAGIDRVVVDREHGLFYGYHIEAEPTPEGRIKFEITPLREDFLGDNPRMAPKCEGCPPFTRLSASLVRYPEATIVDDGALFTFELLRKPATGETIADQVRINRRETEPDSGPRLPTDGRFSLDLKLKRIPGKPGMFLGEFQLNDVGTGKRLAAGTVAMAGDSPQSQLRFPGLTSDGRPLRTDIRVSASPREGTLTYEFELREADVLVQSQRVTVPMPPP